MSAGVVDASRPGSRTIHIAIKAAGIFAGSAAATFAVWFAGFDWLWAVAMVLAVSAVGVVFATLKFEESATWDPPVRETPRGIRLALPLMEESLAACDRLARSPLTRPIRAVLISERDDRMARATVVRQMRALLVGELRARGVSIAHQSDDAVVELFGPESLTVFQPNDSNPVTTVVIAKCLDAVEHLRTDPPTSQ